MSPFLFYENPLSLLQQLMTLEKEGNKEEGKPQHFGLAADMKFMTDLGPHTKNENSQAMM